MVAHVFISGFVQGVGFRQFVKRSAKKIGLTGWVRNLPDGRVEAKFAGSKDKIEKAIGFSRKGNFLSEIKEIEVFWEDSLSTAGDQFDDFIVLRPDR